MLAPPAMSAARDCAGALMGAAALGRRSGANPSFGPQFSLRCDHLAAAGKLISTHPPAGVFQTPIR